MRRRKALPLVDSDTLERALRNLAGVVTIRCRPADYRQWQYIAHDLMTPYEWRMGSQITGLRVERLLDDGMMSYIEYHTNQENEIPLINNLPEDLPR